MPVNTRVRLFYDGDWSGWYKPGDPALERLLLDTNKHFGAMEIVEGVSRVEYEAFKEKYDASSKT